MWLTQESTFSPVILIGEKANYFVQTCLSFPLCEVGSITSAQPPSRDYYNEMKKMKVLHTCKWAKGKCYFIF